MKSPKLKELTTKLNNQLADLKPGESLVKENLSGAVYHMADGVSSSKIKTYIDCASKYEAHYVTKVIPRVEKKIFDLGSAAHSYVLELEKFSDEFVIQPAEFKVRRGKAWDIFKAEQDPDATVITLAEYEQVKAMSESVDRHTSARQLLSGGKAETSFFKRDVETGLIIKCRPDYRIPGRCIDYKSCVSSEPGQFGRDAKRMGYHISAAIYLDITGDDEFIFVATEKTPPYVTTAPIFFESDAMELGLILYRNALNAIATSEMFGHWSDYTDQPVGISLSSWERDHLENLVKMQNGVLSNVA